MNRSLACIGICGAFFAAGCSNNDNSTKPLTLDQVLNRQQPTDSPSDRRGALTDRPHLMYDNVGVDLLNPEARPKGVEQNPDQREGVAPSVAAVVRSPRDEAVARAGLGTSAATLPSARAATNTPGVGTGSTITLGAVVVDVNGQPIFANKVLQTIAPVLAAKAKDLDEAHFKVVATDEVQKQVRTLIADELQYAVADQSLDQNDKNQAEARTMMWRDSQVRRAGGSIQLARQAAAAQGLDFDEMVKDQYRLTLRHVYFSKKELPKIQISADDMREYYRKHLKDLFTQRSEAQFRVIKVDFKRTGDRDKALAKANDLHDRVNRGEDFATIAGEINDDPFLMHNKGDVTAGAGWIDRGAYVNSKVEDAVWLVHPGEITPVVESGEAFYLGKLEQKRVGRVESFDEEAVQARIRQTLEAEQMTVMQAQTTDILLSRATVNPMPPRIEPVVEIAMQKYRDWASAK